MACHRSGEFKCSIPTPAAPTSDNRKTTPDTSSTLTRGRYRRQREYPHPPPPSNNNMRRTSNMVVTSFLSFNTYQSPLGALEGPNVSGRHIQTSRPSYQSRWASLSGRLPGYVTIYGHVTEYGWSPRTLKQITRAKKVVSPGRTGRDGGISLGELRRRNTP
jgi:hypothetical protein